MWLPADFVCLQHIKWSNADVLQKHPRAASHIGVLLVILSLKFDYGGVGVGDGGWRSTWDWATDKAALSVNLSVFFMKDSDVTGSRGMVSTTSSEPNHRGNVRLVGGLG